MKKVLQNLALLSIVLSASFAKLNAQTNQTINFESQPSKLGKAYDNFRKTLDDNGYRNNWNFIKSNVTL